MAFHKRNRLENYDYSTDGVYYLTICTDKRKQLLSRIVARGILDAPETVLSPIGSKIEDAILFLNQKWDTISVHSYVIMPNHVHLLVEVRDACNDSAEGASRMPRATDAVIPRFVSALKRYTSRECRYELWQTSYYDHVIRDDRDYQVKWEYIANNPARWLEDEYYCEEGAE